MIFLAKQVNGENVLGQKIVEVAEKIKQNCKNEKIQYEVTFLLWNSKLNEHVSIPFHSTITFLRVHIFKLF